jgi:predicted nucleic acid-binding Zn ribbon protein
MESFVQLLALSVIGVVLLWFGYTLFFGIPRKAPSRVSGGRGKGKRKYQGIKSSYPGAPRTCPVCSAKLEHGERVKSAAFPGIPGQGRLMHISGCIYCMDGDRRRICPVCGATLRDDQFLIARMFEKPTRSHVHVLGCSQCRGPPSARR